MRTAGPLEELEGVSFVSLTIPTYDARGNRIKMRDGRRNFLFWFPDFYNRAQAHSDQNGNGWVRQYDDASNV